MNVPSEFVLLHCGNEIAMLAICIRDLVANLPINNIVFVNDIQKLSISFHLKELYSHFRFCCQSPAFICILEGR